MRYEKEDQYIEVSETISANYGEACFVDSNLGDLQLPIEFREQIPKSEKDKIENLKRSVLDWASRNGFVRVEQKK